MEKYLHTRNKSLIFAAEIKTYMTMDIRELARKYTGTSYDYDHHDPDWDSDEDEDFENDFID